MPLLRSETFLAYIRSKLADEWDFAKFNGKFWLTKNVISETVRDRAKRTKIWDHQRSPSSMFTDFANESIYLGTEYSHFIQ